jgi:VanZ family protein
VNDVWLPLSYRRLWLVLSISLVAIVVAGSLAPPGQVAVPVGDKWQHAMTYFALAAWFAGLTPRRNYPWVAAALLLLGLCMELLQHTLTAHRVADARDMAANSVGIAAGMVAAYIGLGAWAQRIEAWLRRSA